MIRNLRSHFTNTLTVAIFTLLAGLAFVLHSQKAHAAVSQTEAVGQVSFTFDDAYASTLTKAAPALTAHGVKGTAYVTTGFIGQANHLTWDQATQLKNIHGWEIGGHSVTHPEMTQIDATQLETEVKGSYDALAAHGFTPKAFATPFGDYNPAVEAAIAKYYTSHRGFHDIGYNTYPYNKYLLRVQQVQAGVTVNEVKGYIDQAKASKIWLILVFHDIKDLPSSDPTDYEYSTANLSAIAQYVKEQGVKNVNISEGIVTGQGNLVPNSGFQNGLGDGWSTPNPENVAPDTAGNGSADNPTDSVKMTSGSSNTHLFSPQVVVDSSKKYWVNGYVNMTEHENGEAALYIDEYDALGNWLSGQYAQALDNPEFKDFSFIYTTTSANIARIRLQVILTANSGITAYIDNLQIFEVVPMGPGPNPNPTITNVMPNSDFNAGLSNGWTTDNAVAFSADAHNNGAPANPQHSVKLTAGATNAHLFAPQIAVQSTKTYTIKAFLNLLTLQTGEVAFYIDEYDTNGNWVSGKYITAKRATGSEEMTFDYTPTSANVVRASLQVILTANSSITGYLDNVQWLVTNDTPPAPTTVTVMENNFTSGFGNWTTDAATNVTHDTSGKVKFVATNRNVHLFSPKVNVSSAKTYNIQSFLDVTTLTSGEVAFYIDEYDVAGNWVSGKYVMARNTVGSGNVSFTYVPTSTNVAQAAIQVIVTSNSGITAYFDSFKWTTTTA